MHLVIRQNGDSLGIRGKDKDGKKDVLVGEFWYEAPDWKAHAFRWRRRAGQRGYLQPVAHPP